MHNAITSTANPLIKTLRSLHTRKGRKTHGLFLAEGLRIIRDAFDCGWQARHLVFAASKAEDATLEPLIAHAAEHGCAIHPVGDAVLAKLSRRDNPQMVLASFTEHWHGGGLAAIGKNQCWVALDRVRDPGNLGTILRSVDGAGAGGVILIGECCDAWSVEAVRASMGAVFTTPIMRMEEAAFLREITAPESPPLHIIGTALTDGAVDYREASWDKTPMLLLMGNEQDGLSPRLMEACHEIARLPMHGRADSLNLAVATGICLYETLRHRG